MMMFFSVTSLGSINSSTSWALKVTRSTLPVEHSSHARRQVHTRIRLEPVATAVRLSISRVSKKN